MNHLLGVDPGPEHSGICLLNLDTLRVECSASELPNESVRHWLRAELQRLYGVALAIEGIGYQGEHTGASVHQTCRWIGRFEEIAAMASAPVAVLERADVARHFTLYRGAPKGAVHDAVRTRFYPTGEMTKVKGTRRAPGPCHGVSGHAWDALAVALAHAERSGVWRAPGAAPAPRGPAVSLGDPAEPAPAPGR